ncbi:MAG: redoxin domain-containing protein [Gemmatimonadota bacterium]
MTSRSSGGLRFTLGAAAIAAFAAGAAMHGSAREVGPGPIPEVSQEAEKLGTIPADRWLRAPERGLSGEDLRGKVVLVEFWTYLCYNCKNVEGWMKETHAELAPRGLAVVGVHTPEFEVERDVANVTAYMEENGIDWPVAIDNGFRVWRKYNRTNAWPAFLVYDRSGNLVFRRAGERAVHGARAAIDEALAS